MNEIDSLAVKGIRRALTKPVPDAHPALRVLDLTGVRPTDIARILGISPQLLSAWRSGSAPPATKYHSRLFELAAGAVAAAQDTIGETAVQRPDLINTQGFMRYVARAAEAAALLEEFKRTLEGKGS